MSSYVYTVNDSTLTWNIQIDPGTVAIRVEWKQISDSNYSLVYEGSPTVTSKQIALPGENMVARYENQGGGGGWSPYSDPESVAII